MLLTQMSAGTGSRGHPFTARRVKPIPCANVPAQPARGSLQKMHAISREKKEDIIVKLKEKLSDSIIVFGMRFKGLDVPTVQKFRRGLPEKSAMLVTKNTLMKVAVQQMQGWSTIADSGLKGENAWVFVREEALHETIRYYLKFEEALFADAKKAAGKGQEVKPPTELSCVVMDNKLLTVQEFKACEKLPNKKELIATIAGLLKQPPTSIAVGIKMIPTKLAVAIKMLSELDEDKSKTVGSFAKAA